MTLDALTDDEVLGGLVGDIETFASAYWGQAPLRRAAGPEWATLLSVADVEALMLTGARVPTFRLVRDGERLGPEASCRPVRLAGRMIDDVADAERIAHALAEGATLVVQSLEHTNLTLAQLCRALERATSHPVQANAYLTPAGGVGLATHHDDHDVIVVQQSGTKTWTVAGIDGDVTLTPGDVLYLPAGTDHGARAQTRASLHLTIGVMTQRWAALARRVIDTFDDLQAPLPLGYARDERAAEFAAHVADVLRAVSKRMADADAKTLAMDEATRAQRRLHPSAVGRFADVLYADDLTLDTVVARRADAPVRLEPTDDKRRIEVVLRDRRIGFPAIGRAALERLITGDAVGVRELPGIDDDSKLVVVRRLVRAGLLRVVS